MCGVFRIRSIGEQDAETESVVLARQGDVPDQKGRLKLHNELNVHGTRAELQALFGGAYGVRDSFTLALQFTPVAKSKSAGG